MINKIYEKIKSFIKDNYKFLLGLLVIFLLFYVELPFVIYTPGGTIDLKNRIILEDKYESSGKLQMAYVRAVKGTLPFLGLSYLIDDWDIMKKEDITYENETIKEKEYKDKINMQASIDNAILASYRLLGKEIKINKVHNIVTYIDKNADTDLKLYDEIISIEGVDVTSLDEYRNEVLKAKENDILTLKVLRNKKEIEVKIKVYNTTDGLKTGISMISTYDYTINPKIDIKSKMSESGPSGGLMMALGIYDALVEYDITKGYNIVGTGTIDEYGKVGEIGGVKYKLLGAYKKGAEIFICPKENYEEVKSIVKQKNYDIIVLTGDSLDEIIESLKELPEKE